MTRRRLNRICRHGGRFFVSRLARFTSAGELGVIAGGGLLLCLLAGYTVLPAILVLLPIRPPSSRKKIDPTDGVQPPLRPARG